MQRLVRGNYWGLLIRLFLSGLLLYTSHSTAPGAKRLQAASAPGPARTLTMGEWHEIDLTEQREAGRWPFSLVQSKGEKSGKSEKGWALRFEKVNAVLEVRVGSEKGPLISWPNHGLDGKYTWSWKDEPGESQPIGQWVGNSSQIKLWARVSSHPDAGNQPPYCVMDTLYDGKSRRRWEFDSVAEYEVWQ